MSKRLNKLEKFLENYILESKKEVKEIRQLHKEIDIKIDKLSSIVGASEHNKGLIVEDIFYNSLSNSMILGEKKYNYIMKNIDLKLGKNKIGDIDIALFNTSYIALIEIKAKANIKDFKQIEKYLDNYKKIYPYEKRKILIYYGSTCFNKEIENLANLKGYGLISLHGNIINVETENIKEFEL